MLPLSRQSPPGAGKSRSPEHQACRLGLLLFTCIFHTPHRPAARAGTRCSVRAASVGTDAQTHQSCSDLAPTSQKWRQMVSSARHLQLLTPVSQQTFHSLIGVAPSNSSWLLGRERG